MTNLDSILKSRDIIVPTKVHVVKAMVFSSSHVWMWELEYKESWALKNWCFWTVVLDKTLESPLSCKEIQRIHPEGNQSWIFIGRTDAEAKIPILWPPDVKNWLFWKDHDAGKDWRHADKGITKDEMVGWHHWLDGQEFEQAPGAGNGHRSLACCSPWGRKESDKTEGLNWTELNWCRESMRRCIFCSSEVKWHLTSSSLFSLMMSFHWLDTGLFFFLLTQGQCFQHLPLLFPLTLTSLDLLQ